MDMMPKLSNSLIEKDRAYYIHPVVSIPALEDPGLSVAQSGQAAFPKDTECNE